MAAGNALDYHTNGALARGKKQCVRQRNPPTGLRL